MAQDMDIDNHTLFSAADRSSIADKSMPSCKSVASGAEISLDEYTFPLRQNDVICSTALYPSPNHWGNERMIEDITKFVPIWGRSDVDGRFTILAEIRFLVEQGRGGFFLIADGVGTKCRKASDEVIDKTIRAELYNFFNICLRPCDVLFPSRFEANINHSGNLMMRKHIDHIVSRCDLRYDTQILLEIKSTVMRHEGNPLFLFEGYTNAGGMSYCRQADDEEIHGEIRVELRHHLVPQFPTDIICQGGPPRNEVMKRIVKGFVVRWGNTNLEGREAILVDIRDTIEGQRHSHEGGSMNPRLLVPVFQDVDGTFCRRANDEEFEREISSIWPRFFHIRLLPTDILCPHRIYHDSNHPGNVTMRGLIFEERYNWAEAGSVRRKEILVSITTRIIAMHNARFLFQGRQDGDIRYCREAFPGEIEQEIWVEFRSHFNAEFNERDYIFGGGAGIAQWTGNVFFRDTVIDRRRRAYQVASKAQKGPIVDEVYNAIVNLGGRFLYAWDSRPHQGVLVEEDQDRIKTKLTNILREKRGRN